jgi:hypothetical protein
VAAFALSGISASAAVTKEVLMLLAVRKLIRVPPLTYYSTRIANDYQVWLCAAGPLDYGFILPLNQDEKNVWNKLLGILYFFQTIKV